ncbi:hypothetical protein [Streptomyces sp. NPDC056600]|uniref:hypothetical protein n=1 Tax=Streptomyces sp. NPDC056600 TaxID=3345874 RepID=UPI0036B76EDB
MAFAAWGFIAALFAAVAVWTMMLGLVGVGLVGTEEPLRITACRWESGSRGGDVRVCTGRLASGREIEGRFRGEPGDTVPLRRMPGGVEAEVDTDVGAWAAAVLLPVLPLTPAGLAAWASVRSFGRRGKPVGQG